MHRPKVTSVTIVLILEEYSTAEHDFTSWQQHKLLCGNKVK